MAGPCMQVLEGWLFLGNIQAARALAGATVQDLTHGVPSDIFRTCVARVTPTRLSA